MTVAELIAELSALDPETIVLVYDSLGFYDPCLRNVAGTEYGIHPGRKKIAVMRKS